MTDDFRQLEREVNDRLAHLGDQLDVEPDPAALSRLRSAVRHEVNERWLAEQSHPEPASDVLAQVKSVTRAALRRPAGNVPSTGSAPRPWRTIVPVLATAATVALVITLAWRAGSPDPSEPIPEGMARIEPSDPAEVPAPTPNQLADTAPTPSTDDPADPIVDMFVEAAERVWSEDPTTEEIRLEIDSLEETLSQRDSSHYEIEDSIDDIESDLDALLAEPEWS